MPEPSVSQPTGFQKVLHVEWDAQAGAFKGLPKEWAAALPEGVGGRRLFFLFLLDSLVFRA